MSVSPEVAARRGADFLVGRQPAGEVQTPESFDEELRMVGETARRFVEREIAPVLEQLEGLDYDLNRQLLAKAGELGLLAVDIPAAYGGLGLSKTASLLVSEKLAASGSFNVTFNAHTCIGTLPLVYFGSEEQKERYLPKLATGELVAAYCLTEPGSGSDARAAKTRADRDGSSYRLNGSKMWITNAGFADLFTVFAQLDGDQLSAFLVERGARGLSLGAEERKMGIKGSSTRQVIFEDALVPAGNLLGEAGKGHRIAFSILNLGRLKLAAGAVGGSKEMLRLASGYARSRHQFGRAIGEFGLIQEKLGGMATLAFALESAVYRLAGELDRLSLGSTTPAEQLEALGEFVIEYSLVKVCGSEILDEIVDETLQIHGGYGFSAEYPVESAYRNSRINRIFEGTNEINRLLASGQLLKRALGGRQDLLAAGQAAVQGVPHGQIAAPPQLQEAVMAVEGIKKSALLVGTAAAMTYQQAALEEQELLARVADLLALAYLADSALLRAERLIGQRREEAASLLARLAAFDAVDRALPLGREALRRIGGERHQGALQAYLPEHGQDLIALRREAALLTLDAEGYPLA